MASLSRGKDGTRILFMDGDRQRRTIRLGKIPAKAAEAFHIRVERLIASEITGTAVDGQTAAWLAELPESTYDKLVRVGLATEREVEERYTLGDLIEQYFANTDVKESTETRYRQTADKLAGFFGNDVELDDIVAHEADRWRTSLIDGGYAEATASRDVGIARMLFRQAVRWDWLGSNPFESVKCGSQSNRSRMHYVTPEDAAKLLFHAPNSDWRCIIALARWGGLRCPSEVLRLRWADIDWATNRFRVKSPKTEHHVGKADRLVPLFPELQRVIMEAFQHAPDGAEYVVASYRDAISTNLRTGLNRIIHQAGLTVWPRLFNALRASRATELASEYPSAVCTAWLGHTAAVAEVHYHMVRETDYERAAGACTTETGAESGARLAQMPTHRTATQDSAGHRKMPHTSARQDVTGSGDAERMPAKAPEIGATGLEPVTSAM